MRQAAADRFYGILAELERRVGGPRMLSHCNSKSGWPKRGVYFFFEHGENRANGRPRIVRVGTHAVSAGSKTHLWKRLSQHRGTLGGSNPGAGNHRGSIFRLHVGTALLATRDGWPASVHQSWLRKDGITPQERAAESSLEIAVSKYIGEMPFLWVSADGDAGADSDRAAIERGAIALLTNADRPPIDCSSSGWLGRYAAAPEIRDSGLWNVKHVHDVHGVGFIDLLERRISDMPDCFPAPK